MADRQKQKALVMGVALLLTTSTFVGAVGAKTGNSSDISPSSETLVCDSSVRTQATSAVTSNIKTYDYAAENNFRASYWRSLSAEDARRAAEAFVPGYTDIAISLLEKAAGTTATGGATALIDAVEMSVNLLVAAKNEMIARHLSRYTDGELREKLWALADNAEKIKNQADTTGDGEFTCQDKSEIYIDRKRLLEETYKYMTGGFDGELYRNRHNYPDYLRQPDRLENIAYGELRSQMGRIRGLLALDYHATTSWLKNRPSSTNIAMVTKTGFKTRKLGNADQGGAYTVVDTLDSSSDYAIYRMRIPEAQTGGSEKLGISVSSSDADDLSVYVTEGSIPNVGNPFGENPNRLDESTKRIETNGKGGLQAGDTFYVLVKAKNATTYRMDTGTVGTFDLFGEPLEPNLIDKKAFNGYASPKIESISVTPEDARAVVGEHATINVRVTNVGPKADRQSIAISLPTVDKESNVEIVSHDFQDKNVEILGAGSEVGARYGYTTRNIDYPLIEANKADWGNDETHHLKIKVSMTEAGDFPIYVKSIANRNGVWTAAPDIGGASQVDQQSEFVKKRKIKVVPPNPQIQLSDFSVSPSKGVEPVSVTATATAKNVGNTAGSKSVPLVVDGETVDEIPVQLGAGESAQVSLTHTLDSQGDYSVTLADLPSETVFVSGSDPPGSTSFQVSNLNAPSSTMRGDTVGVSATVGNTGDQQAAQPVELTFDGSVVNSTDVTLAGGASQQVDFSLNTSGVAAGTYSYTVSTSNDSETGQITVENSDTNGTSPGNGSGIKTISSCTDINSPGEYTLTQNITNRTLGFDCVNIFSNDVILNGTGHTIDGVNRSRISDYGVVTHSSSENVTIKNLVVRNWTVGIATTGSYYPTSTTITNNTIMDARRGVLVVRSSNNNTVSNNFIKNTRYGISLTSSSNTTVSNNIIKNTAIDGIEVLSADLRATDNVLSNNTISSTSGTGVSIGGPGGNVISDNRVNNNNVGVGFYRSHNNTMSGNTVRGNHLFGVEIRNSADNLIYNNILNNSDNTFFYHDAFSDNIDSKPNVWNITSTSGTNIIGGPLLGGNYYAHPNGTGFSQSCTDTDGNEICGNPRRFNGNNIDHLPLTASGNSDTNLTTAVSLTPSEQTVGPSETTTFDVVVENADGGVGAANFSVALGNASVGTITDATVTSDLGAGNATRTEYNQDNSSVEVSYYSGDTADTGSVIIGTMTVQGDLKGSTSVSLSVPALGTESENSYTVNGTNGASLTVADSTPPTISNYAVSNPRDRIINVTFHADEALSDIEVILTNSSGTVVETLTESDFDSFGERYTATAAMSQDDEYTATLNRAADTAGNNGASEQSDSVSVSTPPKNQPPSASFASSPEQPTPDEQVTFDASKSSDPDGSIESYEWEFQGDGAIDATGQTVTSSFDSAGDYEVTLTVTDDDGAMTTATQMVSVSDASDPDPATFQISKLNASSSVTQGDTVEISATVENTGDVKATKTVTSGFGGDTIEGQEVALAGGESTMVDFEIDTTDSAPGTYSYSVSTEDDSETAQITIKEAGGGTPGGEITATDSATFGEVNISETSTRAVTVTNEGDGPATVIDTSIEGPAGQEFVVVDNPAGNANDDKRFTLRAGESRTLTVRFAPDSGGNKTATLVVATQNAGRAGVALSGTAVEVEPVAENVLTIRGTGPAAQYTFSATDGLAKTTANGANVNANDEINREFVAKGEVGIGSDSYTFNGSLETLKIDGDAEVYLNGERLSDEAIENKPENVIKVRGTGPAAQYVLSVTNNLQKTTASGANLNGNDAIRRGYVADGEVGISADSYTFDGSLETIGINGNAEVYLNGERVDTTKMPDNAIEIEGAGPAAQYSFATTADSDSIQKIIVNGANSNSNDGISRTTGYGEVGIAKDAYGFDGSIDSLNVDGEANVYVNGRPTAADTEQDHVITVVGTGDAAGYDFAVGSSLDKSVANFANLNNNDEVSGNTATGEVGAASDSFVYNGDISAFSVGGDVQVYVDGEQVDQERVADEA